MFHEAATIQAEIDEGNSLTSPESARGPFPFFKHLDKVLYTGSDTLEFARQEAQVDPGTLHAVCTKVGDFLLCRPLWYMPVSLLL